jgi:hypothetical protein
VPLAPPPAEAPVTAPVLEEPDDDEVGATRNRAAALAAAAAAQMVSATQCSSSHFNPSYATTCRICGQAIPRQTPFMIPRPQLGQLRLSTGDVVPLDRGVLMGRAPRSDAVDRDRPHLIKLPSAENDISRMHVEVRLEGWHVIVTDLGSLNGTVVTRPGTPPETLRPHEGLTVEPGTTVTLADEISFRYEATA